MKQLQKHPNGQVASVKVWKKKGASMSTSYIDETDDESEPENDPTPVSDEGPTAEITKRKRRVSTRRTPLARMLK